MKKKESKSKYNIYKILIFIGVGIFIFFLLFFIFKQSRITKNQVKKVQEISNSSPSPRLKSNSYHSELLDITIDIPSDVIFKEENALREIILEKNGGLIKLHAYGTNRSYKNIKDFLDEIYSSDDALKQATRKQIQIDGKECEILLLIDYKKYYCYLDNNTNSFLSISTNVHDLYDDLDQIARSFRYEP